MDHGLGGFERETLKNDEHLDQAVDEEICRYRFDRRQLLKHVKFK